MLKHIKQLLQDKFFVVAIIVTIILAILSLMNLRKLPISFTFLDKIEHTLAYLIVSFLWLLALRKKGIKFTVSICVVLYGVLLEMLQLILTDYRLFEFMDIIANTIGVMLGYLAYRFIEKKQFKLLNSL